MQRNVQIAYEKGFRNLIFPELTFAVDFFSIFRGNQILLFCGKNAKPRNFPPAKISDIKVVRKICQIFRMSH